MNINRTPSFLVPAELDSGLKRLAALRAESVDALVGDILREGLRARGVLAPRALRIGQATDVLSVPTRNFK
jgi:hypothetical protein